MKQRKGDGDANDPVLQYATEFMQRYDEEHALNLPYTKPKNLTDAEIKAGLVALWRNRANKPKP